MSGDSLRKIGILLLKTSKQVEELGKRQEILENTYIKDTKALGRVVKSVKIAFGLNVLILGGITAPSWGPELSKLLQRKVF